MSAHALLSPSSAHRWLNCPLAPRLEATLPDNTSDYAREGTVAHSLCEVSAALYFKKIKKTEYNKVLKKLKTNSLWDDEMLKTAELYVEHLASNAMKFNHEPYIAFEVRVDISDYVPDGFGKCDCIMFGEDTLIITDYKHGKGVPVSAENNPQLMLYALGALKLYRPLFGDAIKKIAIYIDQPRLNSLDGWEIETEALIKWGEEVKPKAQAAYIGIGEYKAGEWCRFCRANGICKAQAEQRIGAFDDFSNVVGESTALLSDVDMGAVLEKGNLLVEWYKSVQERALERLLAGKKIPGYKLVEGRSIRSWTNQDEALKTIEKSGVEKAMIYNYVPKSLAELEKMLGKAKFDEVAGQYVHNPAGKPTLAVSCDSRKEYNSAAADFADVAKE